MTGILQHIKSFCESTSVKGVPKITKSPTRGLGALWLFAVLFCAACCCIQVGDIVSRYLSHPRVTLVKEEQISILNGKNMADLEFPHIIVCNLNLMSADVSERQDMVDFPKRYYNEVIKWTTCSSCTSEQNELLMKLRRFYYTTHGFYSLSNSTAMQSFAIPAGQLISSCKALVLTNLELQKLPCEQFADLSILALPDAFNCVNIKAKPPYRSFMPLVGFEFVMYLDDLGPPMPLYFNEGSTSAYLTGGKVTIYKPGTIPLPERDGIYLSPGYYNDVKLEVEAWKRLPPPYSQCSLNKTVLDAYKFDGNTVGYNSDTCLGIHVAKKIEEICGCRDSFSFVTVSTKYSDLGALPQCVEPTDPRIMAERYNCTLRIRKIATSALSSRCHEGCHETYYRSFNSQTQWTSKKYLSRIYKEHVENTSYAWRFDKNDETKLLQQIKDNFVSLKVMLSTRKYIKFQEEPAYTASYMVSSLGGALNLWLGITVILVVEVIDYILKVFLVSNDKKQTAPSGGDHKRTEITKNGNNPGFSKEYVSEYGMDVVKKN